MKPAATGMHFNNTQSISRSRKIIFGAFTFWVAFVMLVAPMKAYAEDLPLPTGDGDLSTSMMYYLSIDPTTGQYKLVPKSATVSPFGDFNGDPNETLPLGLGDDEGLDSEGVDNNFTVDGSGNVVPSGTGDGSGFGGAAQSAIGALGTCSIGAILGKLLSSLIGALINTLTGFITGNAIEAGMQAFDCSTHFLQVCEYNPNLANSSGKQVQKEIGGSVPAPSGLIGSYIPTPSLDSIMFCIVNEILTYITQATISWINSGFNGNPVFVQNPQAFVQKIADREVANFAYELSGGVQQATNQAAGSLAAKIRGSAYELFGPIRDRVVMNTIGDYVGSQGFYIPPPTITGQTYTQMNQYGQFTNMGDYGNYMYPPNRSDGARIFYTNPYVRNLEAQSKSYGLYNLDIDGGFHVFGGCPEDTIRESDGNCATRYFQASTRGGQIRDELQNRGMMKYLRVSMANSFDSIITALVNQLVKIAVNKIFEGASQVNGAVQGAVR